MTGGPERWQALRMVWIDAALATGQGLQRADLRAVFGVSVPTASSDLARFAALFPGRLAYDGRRKAYFAPAMSAPAFPEALRRAAVMAADAALLADMAVRRCDAPRGVAA